MPYIVFKTDSREIIDGGVVRTVAEANQIVGERTGLAISVELSIKDIEGAEPGGYYLSDGSFASGVAPSGVEELQNAARGAHVQLHSWARALQFEGIAHPVTEVNKGHDFLNWQFAALAIICLRTTYSISQKTIYCQEVGKGALDVTSPYQFFSKSGDLTAPTAPNTWVDPANGNRVDLSDSITLSGNTNLNLELSELDNTVKSQLGFGTWINNITA